MQPLHAVTKTSVLHVLSNMAQKSATNYPVSCFPQNTFAISQMQKKHQAVANPKLQGIVKTNSILHSY
jgi:hypothetical protein